jgi:hypothetical protein
MGNALFFTPARWFLVFDHLLILGHGGLTKVAFVTPIVRWFGVTGDTAPTFPR